MKFGQSDGRKASEHTGIDFVHWNGAICMMWSFMTGCSFMRGIGGGICHDSHERSHCIALGLLCPSSTARNLHGQTLFFRTVERQSSNRQCWPGRSGQSSFTCAGATLFYVHFTLTLRQYDTTPLRQKCQMWNGDGNVGCQHVMCARMRYVGVCNAW